MGYVWVITYNPLTNHLLSILGHPSGCGPFPATATTLDYYAFFASGNPYKPSVPNINKEGATPKNYRYLLKPPLKNTGFRFKHMFQVGGLHALNIERRVDNMMRFMKLTLGCLSNVICPTYEWSFLVPLIGGRYHIIPQLAVYTTYILPIGLLYKPETAIECKVENNATHGLLQ